MASAGRFHHVAAVEEEPSLHVAQIRFPESLFEARRQIARRNFLQLVFLQTQQLLVHLIGKDQVSGAVVHGNGVSGSVEHCFQSSMAIGELPPFFCQLPFDVPLLD